MLRQRRAPSSEPLLPHHHSFSPEGTLLSPRYRRQARSSQRLFILGLVCLSVTFLVATGLLRIRLPFSSKTPSVSDQHHRGKPQSSEELQNRADSERKSKDRTAIGSQAGRNRDEMQNPARLPEPKHLDGVAEVGVLLDSTNRLDSKTRVDKDVMAASESYTSSRPRGMTFVGNSTTHIICPDGSHGILNDNYCDCSDGSDETKTSACSHLLVQQAVFACEDGSGAIYSSRVSDGVLDCKDGSDERNSRSIQSRLADLS